MINSNIEVQEIETIEILPIIEVQEIETIEIKPASLPMIIKIENLLISLAAYISNLETNYLKQWTKKQFAAYNHYCNEFGKNLDIYATYCDNHPNFKNKVNY